MLSLSHIERDRFFDYFAMDADDPAAASIEEHLATCDTCAREARLAFTFHRLVGAWTAESHAAAYARERLADGLEAAASVAVDAEVARRLRSWRLRWEGRAEACLRVVLSGVHDVAHIVADGVESLARPGSHWQFGEALAVAPVRGGFGAPAEVVLSAGSPEHGATARVEIRTGARPEIVVRIDDSRDFAPLVLLVPVGDAAGVPFAASSRRLPGEPSVVARFVDVAAGDYLVAIEPLD